MPMRNSESFTTTSELSSGKNVKIVFTAEEAAKYLNFWCRTHFAWVPKALGSPTERFAAERLSRNLWFWKAKWISNSSFENPVSRRYTPAKRYCFVVTDEGMKAESNSVNRKASDLRAWVTCWEDDTIGVMLKVI